MKKLFSLLLIFSLTLTFGVRSQRALAAEGLFAEFEERRRAIAEMMEAATVWIVVDGERSVDVGTGFIVGDGYIMTNAHVIDCLGREGAIYVLNEKIPVRQATLVDSIYEDKDDAASGRDLALLRFDPPRGADLPVLSFNFDVKRMDRVSSWGYPAMAIQFDISIERLDVGDMSRLEPPPVIYTEGTVNAIVRDRHGSAILHSASIAGGNSGGPLVNSRGEVVGINTWGYTEEDEGAFLNGAQLAGEVAAFLAENGIEPRVADGREPGQLSAAGPSRQETLPASPGETREDRRREVGDFSVNVPRGWSVIDEEHNTIFVAMDDDSSMVGLIIEYMEGQSLRQVARALSREFEGTVPELDDDVYIFTFTDDGTDTLVVVGEADGKDMYMMIFVHGDWEAPGVYEILNSVE